MIFAEIDSVDSPVFLALAMTLTPGILFIIQALASLSVPALSVFGSLHVLNYILGISLPSVLKWTLVIFAGPIILIVRGLFTSLKRKREMHDLRAREVPIIPGKWPGNLDVLLYLLKVFETGYIAEPFWPIVENLGPMFNIQILGGDGFFTIEPEHIKQVLATEFHNYEKGDPFIQTASAVLGTGVFNSDGDMWKFHRSMTRPFFVRDRISHFDIFARHADTVISKIKAYIAKDNESEGGGAFDVQDLFARFTLDAATEFLFGHEHCVGALGARMRLPGEPVATMEHDSDVFVTAFADAQNELSMRVRRGPIWPLWEIWKDHAKPSMDTVHAYLTPIVTEALRKKQTSQSVNEVQVDKNALEEDDESLLDNLASKTDDVSVLRDELMNIMIAGRDTTAATLTFSAYSMAMYPDITKRLREEILEKVGSSRNPTYEDIREMKYLRAFINETLRLYPIVPFNVRTSINSTTLPPSSAGEKPFYIPPKTSVSYSVFMMHRRTDLWGPDAMEFDPDRFLDERLHKYLTPNPFIFLPFNAGPRICLGQQFAYNEVSFMLVRLLQSFDSFELDLVAQPSDSLAPEGWKTMPGRQAVERLFPKCHLTMYLHKGLWVRMHEASAI